MNLINTLCVLVCLSGHFEINANLNTVAYLYKDVLKDVEDVANTLFASLKLNLNFLNKLNFQKALQIHNITKYIDKNRIVNISDINNNEMYRVINETLNINYSPLEFVKDFSRTYNSRRTNERSRRRVRSLNNFKLDVWTEENMTRRLYKGRQANITHYPFMVSIHENGRFVCSGCIIRRDLVISSASCFQTVFNQQDGSSPTIKFRVGSNYVHRKGYEVAAVHAIFHPSYDPISLRNNLVLLSVHKAFDRSGYKWIKRVKYLHANAANLAETYDKIGIVGWGEKTQRKDIAPSDEMQTKRKSFRARLSVDSLNIYNLEECIEIYSRYYVTVNNICAGFKRTGNGACKYDVGGPGIYNGRLVGIISFGPDNCGSIDKPTVFTRLAPYTGWIHEMVHQVLPRLKKKRLAETRKYGTNKDFVKDIYNKTNSEEIKNNKDSKEVDNFLDKIAKDMPLPIAEHSEDESVDMKLEMSQTKVLNTTEKSYWIDYVTVKNN